MAGKKCDKHQVWLGLMFREENINEQLKIMPR